MIDRFYGLGASVLKASSLVACLVVVISFFMFAVDQLSSASSQQAALVGGPDPSASTVAASPSSAAGPATAPAASKPSTLRRVITRAGQRLTAPFNGFAGSSSSQWLVRSVETALALLVYGFGMGYLVRLLRIRS